MYDEPVCFRCGQVGHLRKNCRSLSRPRLDAGPLEDEWTDPPSSHIDVRSLTRPLEEIADYPAAAARAREILAAALGRPVVSSDAYLPQSDFRERYKLPLRTEAELREIARQQVEESRRPYV